MKTFLTIALVDQPPVVIENPSEIDCRLITEFISALVRNDDEELIRTRLLYTSASLSSVLSISVGRHYDTGTWAE